MNGEYFENFTRSYWNYFLELEERMEATKKYVEYDSDNFKTYSSTYLMLMQAVCSEIDVVGKEIASYYSSEFEQEDGAKSINRWWYEVQDRLPNLSRSISFSNAYELTPWMNYRVVKTVSKRNNNGNIIDVTNYNLQPKVNSNVYATPKWWNAYNKVKHKRVQFDSDGLNYKKANLLNVSNAFAALYILEFEFIKNIANTKDILHCCGRSRLFGMDDLEKNYIRSLFVSDGTINVQ